MTSLWVKIRDAIEQECATLQHLFAPLEAELKHVAEQDLKEIAEAGIAAAVAAATSGDLTLTTAEAAIVAGGRAVLATAATKGVQLTEQAALGVATLAGLKPPVK